MIIDCHGHFTTVPKSFRDWRAAQIAAADTPASGPDRKGAWVSDDEIREGVGR
jgi:4-oxalmesaconate hydratase